ncbi:Uncharacterized protein YxjI [Pelagirhabdus alkalitolerans]|uniref:Uncharacterized protein YxjI n=1 Tax=Pelagirhabdus alkalitolerans TaxID=1612202 RepID=A0A1G6GMT0_9BACI|nr:LURP-one-related family protein [Pelagirhabdus alkalitolerans]SDB83268.1 Uncharacterized protein YxjI [Pelagirhabdus alkalitolerans]
MSQLLMKQKVFSLGERFTITDEHEQDRFYIEGSILSLPKRFTIKTADEKEVATIEKKVFSFLPRFYVDVDGEENVVINKELSLFKARFNIAGAGIDVSGDWWDKQFEITKDGTRIARVEEKWFTWGDTYVIDIGKPSLEILILAIVVAIDFVKSDERKRRRNRN